MLTRTLLTTASCLLILLPQDGSPDTAETTSADDIAIFVEDTLPSADDDPDDAKDGDLSDAQVAEETSSDTPRVDEQAINLKVFSLRHSEAGTASELVRQLLENQRGVRIVPDVRTNSIWATGDEGSLLKIETILMRIDVEDPEESAPQTEPNERPGHELHDKASARIQALIDEDILVLSGDQPSVRQLQEVLKQLLQERSRLNRDVQRRVIERVDLIQRVEKDAEPDASDDDLEALRDTVRQDFEHRQRLQLAEIEFLKARLANLERRVMQKEKLKDQIIERRIESLLSPPTADRVSWRARDVGDVDIVPGADDATATFSMTFETNSSTDAALQSRPWQVIPSVIQGHANTQDGIFLMRPVEFLEKFSQVQAALRQAQSQDPLPGLYAKELERNRSLLKSQLDAQIQMLQLDLGSHKAALAAAHEALSSIRDQVLAGVRNPSELYEREAAAKAAEAKLGRANVVLGLYLQIRKQIEEGADATQSGPLPDDAPAPGDAVGPPQAPERIRSR